MPSPPSAPSGSSRFASREYVHELLSKAVKGGARDIHLKVGQPPAARIQGELIYFRINKVQPADTEAAARVIIRDEALRANLAGISEYDTSYEVPEIGRFRINVYRQRGTLAIVLRAIPNEVPSLEEIGAPEACFELAKKDRGLILCVGAAGNGKSTTLASMIAQINGTSAKHIVTIEDPIEYVHDDKESSISQREVGADTGSFANALRAALRQDPDVIQVGEIRDQETMEIALKAAETGHLVLSTLHTPDVARTMNRVFALAGGNVDDLRSRLGDCFQGIIAQRLLPAVKGGVVLAAEVCVATGSVRETIKRPIGNPPLKELMEGGAHPYGMQTFEMAIRQLVQEQKISKDSARSAMFF